MRRVLSGVLAAAWLVLAAATAAYADPVTCPDGSLPTRNGECLVTVTDPGADGEGGGSSGPGTPGGAEPVNTGPTVCRYGDQEVPCEAEGFFWNASQACYARLADPQPAPADPVWGGRTEGVIVECRPPHCVVEGVGGDDCYVDYYWAAAGPGVGPSPRELAERAVEVMSLRAIAIGIVPEDLPDRVGLVGMPTWMWVADPGESTTGPITRTASAGGVTVTATARIDRIVWSMGDGATVACGVGTPYVDEYGSASSPDCGHRYTQQGRYTVTATSYWTVEWAGGGQSGTIPLSFADSTQITVGEAQVLVQ